MQVFTFHLLDGDGEARAFELHDCSSEYDARSRLPAMFDRHKSCAAIELWTGDGKLFRAERRPAASIEPRRAPTAFAARIAS